MNASQRSGEIAIAIALFVVGALYVREGLALPFGDAALPGPGVAPLGLGASLATIALGLGLNACRCCQPAGVELGHRRIVIVFGALFAVGLAFERLGAYWTLGLFTAVLIPIVAGTSLVRGLLAAVMTVLAIWLFFRILLGVQLPRGIL
jgi:hypothetical protein